ncbi:hypothetical protein AVEN_245466-1 [Araneus ventricosus]|uniref:Uncharacterized protein n=1 Tax=Araneus ventricosus TaxID=182803 RepID=A0A4Y2D5U8_ARAVE|nr:hypothetical protein AVEN_245466-1 [Araneus ventricosus]
MSLLESLRSSSTRNPLIKEVKDFYRHLLSKAGFYFHGFPPMLALPEMNWQTNLQSRLQILDDQLFMLMCDLPSISGAIASGRKWNMETNNKLHVIKPVLSYWVTKLNRRCDVLTELRIGHTTDT